MLRFVDEIPYILIMKTEHISHVITVLLLGNGLQNRLWLFDDV